MGNGSLTKSYQNIIESLHEIKKVVEIFSIVSQFLLCTFKRQGTLKAFNMKREVEVLIFLLKISSLKILKKKDKYEKMLNSPHINHLSSIQKFLYFISLPKIV